MVAIKTIRLEGLAAAGASLDELINRFKREAQVSAAAQAPEHRHHLRRRRDANGMSYLAMEFIDGVGLERVIASGGALPLERAATWPRRWPTRSTSRTATASSTATSSPPTS